MFPTSVRYGNIFHGMGCTVSEVDGHDLVMLEYYLKSYHIPPKVLIAHTIKGKGVSFMEGSVEWHNGVPKGEQLEIARKELAND